MQWAAHLRRRRCNALPPVAVQANLATPIIAKRQYTPRPQRPRGPDPPVAVPAHAPPNNVHLATAHSSVPMVTQPAVTNVPIARLTWTGTRLLRPTRERP